MSAIAGVNGDVWLSTSPSTALASAEVFIDQGDHIHYWYNTTGPQKDAVSNSSTAGASSLTWSHTVTNAQSNLILVVAVAVGSSGTCSGVTYNSVSLTQLTSKAQGTETCYLFSLVNPTHDGLAHNIVASFSGSVPGIGLGVSYYNVAQSSTFGTAATNSGTSGNASNTVTSTLNTQILLDVLFANGTSSSAGASQVVETNNAAVAPFYFSDLGTVGTNYSLSWTNAGSPTIWIEMSVAMNGSSGAGGTHQAWDSSQTLTVQTSANGTSGWTTDSSGDFTFNWPVGEIVFTSARTVNTNNYVRVSAGNVFALSALDGPHAWKMQLKGQTKDVTPFQASGSWAMNLATIKTMTFSVDCYRQDGRILTEMGTTNISGGIILCQLWFYESQGQRWQFYAFPTSIQQNIVALDVDKQAINFQSTGPVYLITASNFNTTNVTQE